ncbi:hypothetical protein CPAR01_05801 [Colletotrichum paranaense]|uniref:Uncharacterized protein n=1 Tax=Colletotrichum paranaense TaxID=1914294 RepID=A0ABQ9SSB8_9PEZI|nr:uncharacterized protein CPAR01_05801 [Colletotrichum paranaense]KAK1542414.1 hypothetical protein CPAR01_05801 [Colletotrichum paranaense]
MAKRSCEHGAAGEAEWLRHLVVDLQARSGIIHDAWRGSMMRPELQFHLFSDQHPPESLLGSIRGEQRRGTQQRIAEDAEGRMVGHERSICDCGCGCGCDCENATAEGKRSKGRERGRKKQ